MVLPGTNGVHRHARIREATDIIEPQRGRAVANAPGCVSRSSQIRLCIHFFTDFQQLPLLVERLQKAA